MHISFAFLKGICKFIFRQDDRLNGDGSGEDPLIVSFAGYISFSDYEEIDDYDFVWGDGNDRFHLGIFKDETSYGTGNGDGFTNLNTISLEGNDA